MPLFSLDYFIERAAHKAVGPRPECNCKSQNPNVHVTICALMVWSTKVYKIQDHATRMIADEFVARAAKEVNPWPK